MHAQARSVREEASTSAPRESALGIHESLDGSRIQVQPPVVARTPTQASLESLHPSIRQLWQAGSGLASLPGIAPDGALYVASRQGTFDVIEASGKHRFSITLDGTPSGSMYVDRHAWAFLGLATGRLVAITPEGRKYFSYDSVTGIRSDLNFAEGIGLVFHGRGGYLEGINRGGYPTIRVRFEQSIVAGPVGLLGWYVVATSRDEVVWGDRWGRRIHRALGSPVRQLLALAPSSVWALGESSLVAFSEKREVVFRKAGVVAMTVASVALSARGIAGAVVTSDGSVEWLDARGNAAASVSSVFVEPTHGTIEIRLDDDGALWVVRAGEQLWIVRRDGKQGEPYHFPKGSLLAPRMDAPRRRTILGAVDGAVYQVDWPRP